MCHVVYKRYRHTAIDLLNEYDTTIVRTAHVLNHFVITVYERKRCNNERT